MYFADIIDGKRRYRRMTIRELCDKVGVSTAAYYKWMSDPKRVKLSTAVKLADALELDDSERLKLLAK